MMLTMDLPRRTALRALVSKGFMPRQVAKLNERTTDMARDVVDSVIERSECDFVTDVAGAGFEYPPLTERVVIAIAGQPIVEPRVTAGAVGADEWSAE